MLRFFRTLSALEGISFLVILGVTFGIISREYVYVLGMTHGVLFLIYVVALMIVSHKQAWSLVVWILIFIAALIPFAFLAVDAFLKNEIRRTKDVKATAEV